MCAWHRSTLFNRFCPQNPTDPAVIQSPVNEWRISGSCRNWPNGRFVGSFPTVSFGALERQLLSGADIDCGCGERPGLGRELPLLFALLDGWANRAASGLTGLHGSIGAAPGRSARFAGMPSRRLACPTLIRTVSAMCWCDWESSYALRPSNSRRGRRMSGTRGGGGHLPGLTQPSAAKQA